MLQVLDRGRKRVRYGGIVLRHHFSGVIILDAVTVDLLAVRVREPFNQGAVDLL